MNRFKRLQIIGRGGQLFYEYCYEGDERFIDGLLIISFSDVCNKISVALFSLILVYYFIGSVVTVPSAFLY